MAELIAPEKAVSRAFWMVNGPVFLVMFGPFLILAALTWPGAPADQQSAWPVIAFLISWPFAWLTWSVLTPRWRLWAYQRVDDIDALKREAVAGKVIWPDGHWFGRTEIASRALRERLRSLEIEKRTGRSARRK